MSASSTSALPWVNRPVPVMVTARTRCSTTRCLALDHEPVAIGNPPREADAGANREPLPLVLVIPLVGAVGPRGGRGRAERPHRQHPWPAAGPLRVAGCPAPEYPRDPPRRDLLGSFLSAEDGRHASRHGAARLAEGPRELARSGTGTAGVLGGDRGRWRWRRTGSGPPIVRATVPRPSVAFAGARGRAPRS